MGVLTVAVCTGSFAARCYQGALLVGFFFQRGYLQAKSANGVHG